jgi:hypothetical protein
MLVLLAALALPASATAAPLEGEWHLDEPDCAGGPCPHSDSSGNGFTATEVGSPTTVAGRFGNAMRFPTDGDYLNAGNHALLQPPQVTVLTWVRAAATPATVKAVVAQGAAGSCAYSSYSLYTGGSKDVSGLRFYIANALGSTFVSPPASNAMWNGAWHAVAGTYDGAFVRLYVDGNQVGTGTAASGNIGYGLDVSNDFIIGGTDNPRCTDPGGNNFSGDVDEVRVYDRALAPNEIACLAGTGGSSPPVLVDGESPPACGATTPPERPTAELGRILLVRPLRGKVFVKVPGSHKFVRLESLSEVPVRSLIDTRRGKVRLRSARNTKGKTQYGDFAGGIFQALQSRRKKAKGLTELRLKGGNRKKVCGGGGNRATRSSDQPAAQTARRRRRRWRRLRHRARGRFRTRGRHSAATVRGTTWTVADRCDGTLTSVKRGKVVVRDFRRHKNILVRRGKRYLAKAP